MDHGYEYDTFLAGFSIIYLLYRLLYGCIFFSSLSHSHSCLSVCDSSLLDGSTWLLEFTTKCYFWLFYLYIIFATRAQLDLHPYIHTPFLFPLPSPCYI
ncbi:hypothetical protein PRUPE_7G261100 [Prunus persica]|uniref:Uncharacterized protein n=1 Tax=Prunus persica TaxID=3760 RepID=A0A251NH59_PRUPE|nr:hypothetical protein PRUPE_7G261100 [Prunus persica]